MSPVCDTCGTAEGLLQFGPVLRGPLFVLVTSIDSVHRSWFCCVFLCLWGCTSVSLKPRGQWIIFYWRFTVQKINYQLSLQDAATSSGNCLFVLQTTNEVDSRKNSSNTKIYSGQRWVQTYRCLTHSTLSCGISRMLTD